MSAPTSFRTLAELRTFVQETLCFLGDLQADAFELTCRTLQRAGQPCGMMFCLHGPRSVKLTAIWETERNSILFYNSAGQRVRRMTLRTAPEPVNGERAVAAA